MQYFFISGCQWAGVALLRLIIESRPNMQCINESIGYASLISEVIGGESELFVKDSTGIVGFKAPRSIEYLLWSELSDPDYAVFSSL